MPPQPPVTTDGAAAGCPCGGTDVTVVQRGVYRRTGITAYEFTIVACTSCGLGRTIPAPDPDQYARAGAHSSDRTDATEDRYSHPLAEDLAARFPGARVLDVGCNTGVLVEAASQLGLNATGIDVDPAVIEVGRRQGRRISCSPLSAMPRDFDVLIMNHTLEHVTDPDAFLTEAACHITESGRILINVPNRDGWPARVMRDRWIGWLPTEHVFHYTEPAMRSLADRVGLEVESISGNGVIEPRSRGAKCIVKEVVRQAARRTGHGDEIACSLRRRSAGTP